jgi:hypothetical protein
MSLAEAGDYALKLVHSTPTDRYLPGLCDVPSRPSGMGWQARASQSGGA